MIREILPLIESYCCTCGATKTLQVGHYFHRNKFAVRWDLMNCHRQCAKCNIDHNSDPEPYRRYLVMRYGEEGIESMKEKMRLHTTFSFIDLGRIESELESYLSELRRSK